MQLNLRIGTLRLEPQRFLCLCDFFATLSQIQGWVSNGGGVSDLDWSFLFCSFLSFLGLSRFFWGFPICSGMVRGISRSVLFLFLGLLRAPTRNSPERVRDTISTFPEKSGKPPGLETPRLSFSQQIIHQKIPCKVHPP